MSSAVSATTRALGVAELVIEIVSHLDPADLARAARVGFDWLRAAQLALYGDIELYGVERTGLLVRTVTQRPRLAALVKAVYCQVDPHALEIAYDCKLNKLQTGIFSKCSNLKKMLIEGDGGPRMSQLIISAALSSTQLGHLWINGLDELLSIAPHLSALKQLTYLMINVRAYCGDNPSAWPRPTFKLSTLKCTYCTSSIYGDHPGVDQLQWLTSSSRDSLRHLELEGFASEVVGDLTEWGDRLERVRFALFVWAQNEEVWEAAGLARLKAMRRLTLTTAWSEDDGDLLPEDYDKFAGMLREAASRINKELGREMAAVEEN